MNRKLLFAGSAILLLLTFAIGAVVYNSQKAGDAPKSAMQNQAPLTRPHAATLGNVEARVLIVEFLDPACGTCAAFYPFVKRMMADNPDRIRLVLRYAPLHRGSDQVVAALEAARKQGLYWEALDALLRSQAQWVINHTADLNLAWQPLARAGVNVEQAKRDMQSPEIARLVEQDITDMKSINVTKTPEFFVNGRPLPNFGYDELQRLVGEALAQSYR